MRIKRYRELEKLRADVKKQQTKMEKYKKRWSRLKAKLLKTDSPRSLVSKELQVSTSRKSFTACQETTYFWEGCSH
jgi:predicted  nucleic acid-binding Zn-ribbon protein